MERISHIRDATGTGGTGRTAEAELAEPEPEVTDDGKHTVF